MSNNNYKCVLCGKDFSENKKPESSLRLHYYKTHGKKMVDGVLEDIEKSCDHSFRMLRPNNKMEARAIEAGYTKVCEKCQEVE